MGFRQVAPGVLVSTDFQVRVPHPDPCWIVYENDDPHHALATGNGKVLIFSTEELAKSYLEAAGADQELISILKTMSLTWNELVDMFRESHFGAVIDHRGKGGFYVTVPLEKNI